VIFNVSFLTYLVKKIIFLLFFLLLNRKEDILNNVGYQTVLSDNFKPITLSFIFRTQMKIVLMKFESFLTLH